MRTIYSVCFLVCMFFAVSSCVPAFAKSQEAQAGCEYGLSGGMPYLAPTQGNAVGRGIDTFLSWFGLGEAPAKPTSVEVTEAELQNSPIAVSILKLAEKGALLNQTDSRLSQFNLLIPNGGLCVSTSVLNAIGGVVAADREPEAFEKLTPILLDAMVKAYPEFVKNDPTFNSLNNIPPPQPGEDVLTALLLRPLSKYLVDVLKDARFGALSPALFLEPMRQFLAQTGAELILKQPATLETFENFGGTNSIAIISASIRDRRDGSMAAVHGRHALVLLAYLPETGEVVISDPNRPNNVFRETLQTDEQGRRYFRTRVNYTANGSNAYIEELQIIRGNGAAYPLRDTVPAAAARGN
jgi:hypothetical protein